jgi:hypothetical protein
LLHIQSVGKQPELAVTEVVIGDLGAGDHRAVV